jgi:hypothetical protein
VKNNINQTEQSVCTFENNGMKEKAYSKGGQVYNIFKGSNGQIGWKGYKVIKVEC